MCPVIAKFANINITCDFKNSSLVFCWDKVGSGAGRIQCVKFFSGKSVNNGLLLQLEFRLGRADKMGEPFSFFFFF